MWQRSSAVFSNVASQQEGAIPGSEPLRGEFICSPCVCVGPLWVLRLPPTVQNHADRG